MLTLALDQVFTLLASCARRRSGTAYTPLVFMTGVPLFTNSGRDSLVMSYAPWGDEARRGNTSSSKRVRGVLPASIV